MLNGVVNIDEYKNYAQINIAIIILWEVQEMDWFNRSHRGWSSSRNTWNVFGLFSFQLRTVDIVHIVSRPIKVSDSFEKKPKIILIVEKISVIHKANSIVPGCAQVQEINRKSHLGSGSWYEGRPNLHRVLQYVELKL